MKNIVILISGSGSNMAAIVNAARTEHWESRWQARVAAVISNRPGAQAWNGRMHRVWRRRWWTTRPTGRARPLMPNWPRVIDAAYAPALVVLAGFMRILTPGFVQHYAGRLVNIHPSLLPAFPGLNTHQRAIDAGCKVAGATVHRVTADLDYGPILAQAVVPVLPDDTAERLAARVLTQEHLIYPQAVRSLIQASF
jgi:phosphoribosylglycinamide formyltransferase-1